MAHMRESRPDFGLGSQARVLKNVLSSFLFAQKRLWYKRSAAIILRDLGVDDDWAAQI